MPGRPEEGRPGAQLQAARRARPAGARVQHPQAARGAPPGLREGRPAAAEPGGHHQGRGEGHQHGETRGGQEPCATTKQGHMLTDATTSWCNNQHITFSATGLRTIHVMCFNLHLPTHPVTLNSSAAPLSSLPPSGPGVPHLQGRGPHEGRLRRVHRRADPQLGGRPEQHRHAVAGVRGRGQELRGDQRRAGAPGPGQGAGEYGTGRAGCGKGTSGFMGAQGAYCVHASVYRYLLYVPCMHAVLASRNCGC